MPVYEFECPQGHVTEELVPMGTKHTKCAKCSKKAKKIPDRNTIRNLYADVMILFISRCTAIHFFRCFRSLWDLYFTFNF